MGDEAAQRVGLAHCLCPQGTWSGRPKGAMNPKLLLPAGKTPVILRCLMGWLPVTFIEYLKVSTSGMGCFFP